MAWDDCFTERDYDSYMGYDQPEQDPDDEPDHNDEVLCCPDCERPNQFGELCADCERQRDLDHDEQNCSICEDQREAESDLEASRRRA